MITSVTGYDRRAKFDAPTSEPTRTAMKLRAVLWLCLILLPTAALAQGVVAGVATDPNGQVLPGVVVELAATAAGELLRQGVTDAEGRYEFRNVGPGVYSLTFTLPGFSTLRRDGVAVAPGNGALATVDARLRAAPVGETIQVPPPRRVPPPFGPEPRRCLHGDSETTEQRERRQDALAAMRLFDRVIRTFGGARTQSPSWEEVSSASLVRRLVSQGDALAMRIRWGTSEPLPGWGIAWVTSRTRSRFALTDLRDACAFTYSSEDPDVIPRSGTQLLSGRP